ncbi:IS3 family transposase, partial [Salmonella enterica]
MNTGLSGAIQPLRPDGFYFCSRHGRTTYLSGNWHSNTQQVRLFNMSDKYVCGLNSTFFAIPECSALLKMPQNQMKNYQNVLQSNGVVQSMSRKGNCLDNAVMEGFFGILKSECYYLNKFKNTQELRRAIEEYIDYYNHERISSRLEGLSPVEYRTQVQLA